MNKELKAVIFTSFSASFLLGGYECIRSASNTLYKAEFGAESLAVAGVVMPIALVFMIWLYGKSISRYGTRLTLHSTYLVSAAVLIGGYFLLQAGFAKYSAVLLIFRKIYVVLIIEQYWSFLNSTLKEPTAKKFNGPICGIASVGAIIGGYFVGGFAQTLGTNFMVLVAGVSLLPCILCSELGFRGAGEPKPETGKGEVAADQLGLKEFRKHPMLLALLALIIVTQVLSTALELNFQTILQDTIPNPDEQTAYSGNFFANLNLVSFFMQFLLAPLLLKFVPLGLVHILIPLIHLSFGIYVLAAPGLFIAGLGLLLFKCIDYSVFRAAKEVLYIPLSFAARYRAKQVIDVFGYRTGEGLTSLGIVAIQRSGIFFDSIYSVIVFAASGVWLMLLLPILKPRKIVHSVKSEEKMHNG